VSHRCSVLCADKCRWWAPGLFSLFVLPISRGTFLSGLSKPTLQHQYPCKHSAAHGVSIFIARADIRRAVHSQSPPTWLKRFAPTKSSALATRRRCRRRRRSECRLARIIPAPKCAFLARCQKKLGAATQIYTCYSTRHTDTHDNPDNVHVRLKSCGCRFQWKTPPATLRPRFLSGWCAPLPSADSTPP
jgi:hypothetical protein